jgi:hypothetical protein
MNYITIHIPLNKVMFSFIACDVDLQVNTEEGALQLFVA